MNRSRTIVILIALAAIAAVPYARTARHAFIDFDDNQYITENSITPRGLTAEGIAWAFTTTKASNWHPITWLSHMVDCSLFVQSDGRQWAGGHHLVNVLIHLLNTLLVFGVLQALTKAPWRSALVAGLFAVHPLHVESVAWIAERKDVLSTMFGLLAIMGYVGYVQRPSLARYLLIVVLFGLSLMSKPMLVTLPCVLLLLDYWPLGRLQRASVFKLLTEKLPLLVMSIGSSVITVIAQKTAGAVLPTEAISLPQRIANALVAYAAYIGKTIWPVDLAVMYPHPGSWPAIAVVGAAAILIALSAMAFMRRRTQPHLIVGWLWFLGTLVPVIGLVQVGHQSMADRYTYVPLIGLAVMAAWSLPRVALSAADARAKLTLAATAAALVLLCALTWKQIGHWRNTESLMNHAIAATADNFIAHTVLGFARSRRGETDLAFASYREAIRIKPTYGVAHENLGSVLLSLGRTKEAIEQFERAVSLQPRAARTRNNLAVACLEAGQFDNAVEHGRDAVERDPHNSEYRYNLARAHSAKLEFGPAIEQFEAALRLQPNRAEAHAHLGVALAAQDRMTEAVGHLALNGQQDGSPAK